MRFIVSAAANGPRNMSLDETLFNGKIQHAGAGAVLRVYTWDRKCVTIGYFQKYGDFSGYGLPVTRRLTGGLSVVHGSDVSFGFVCGDDTWEHVYDQEKTYERIHSSIRDALRECGVNAEFANPEDGGGLKNPKGNICVQTLYPHDLLAKGKKIVGSCQRRRGKTLLVQGSIHLPAGIDRPGFYEAWEKNLGKLCNMAPERGVMSDKEMNEAVILENTRYGDDTWNKKY